MSYSAMPEKLTGIPFAKQYAKGFLRHLIAFAIGCSILALMIFYINDSSRTEALFGIMKVWTFIMAIDIYITSSYFIWPKKPKTVNPAESKKAEV